MAAEQRGFEALRAKLGDVLNEDETILAAAPAWGGPRALTISMGVGPFLRAFVFTSPIAFLIGLSTGLVRFWLLVVTPTRLIAIRLARLGTRPTGEVRSFDFTETDNIGATISFWSGWLVEVKAGGQLVKYAVLTPAGLVKRRLQFPPRWKFLDFANTLLDSWRQMRR